MRSSASGEPGTSIGAEVVNGPGALSLNQLNTTDPEAAQRFYSDLFGWRFEEVQGGPGPYYGDLPRRQRRTAA